MKYKITSLTVDLQANTANHDRNMSRSAQAAQRYGRAADKASMSNQTLSKGFSTAANQAGVLYGPLNGLSGRLSYISSGLSAMGTGGFAAAAGVAALVAVSSQGLTVFEDWERRQFRTEALLRSTGNSAGLTATQLDQLARSVAMNTLGSVEGVNDAINILQTFRTVQGEVFTTAIALSQDLATVMGGDAKAAALQLGKALEDPTTGLNALKRSGVSFSEAEKEIIKDLQETNRLAEAQGMILAKLAQQVGGAGSGEAQGLAGAYDTLGQVYDEFLFDLTETSRLGGAATETINTLARGIRRFHKSLMPEDDTRFAELAVKRAELQADLQAMAAKGYENLPDINPFGFSKNEYKNSQRELSEINAEMRQLQEARKAELTAQTQAQQDAADAAAAARKESEEAAARQSRERAQKAAADRLKRDQASTVTALASMDQQFATEAGKLEQQHQVRLASISRFQLSEQELSRRGFESIEALRDEYRQRSEDRLAEQKAALKTRDEEARLQKFEQVRQELRDDEQVELEAWQRRQSMLADAFTSRQITEQHYQALSEKNWAKYQKTLASLEAARTSQMLQAGSQLFDGLAGMAKSFAGEQSGIYKTLFAASKAFAIAESIIKIQQGIANAAALPFPANIPAMATVAAQTASIVGTIQGTNLQGMAHAGIDYVPREGTWLLDKGERVLSPRQNADFTRALNGGGGLGGSVMIEQHFHIGSDGEDRTAGQGDNPRARELAEIMRSMALQVIEEEKLPGGALFEVA